MVADLTLNARLAVELAPCSDAHDVEQRLGLLTGQVGEFQRSVDSVFNKAAAVAPADSPHVAYPCKRESLPSFLIAVDEAGALVSLIFFSKSGSRFCESFCRGYADADGDACVAANAPDEIAAESVIFPDFIAEDHERLVDGIDFEVFDMGFESEHHAARHVAVEAVVPREAYDAVGLGEVAESEIGGAALYAESLGLVAHRHRTPVVVAQDNDRLSFEFGAENALAGNKEVVAVDKSIHGCRFWRMSAQNLWPKRGRRLALMV